TLFASASGYFSLVAYLAERGDERVMAAAVRLLFVLGAGVALGGLLTGRWPERYLLDLQFVTEQLPHLGGNFTIHHNLLAGALVLPPLPAVCSWRVMPPRVGRCLQAAAITLMRQNLPRTQS